MLFYGFFYRLMLFFTILRSFENCRVLVIVVTRSCIFYGHVNVKFHGYSISTYSLKETGNKTC